MCTSPPMRAGRFGLKALTEHADLYLGRTQKRVWYFFTPSWEPTNVCTLRRTGRIGRKKQAGFSSECRISEKENRSKINSPVSPPSFWSERGRGGGVPVSRRRAEGTARRCHGKLRSTCLVPPGMEGVDPGFLASPVLPSLWTALTIRRERCGTCMFSEAAWPSRPSAAQHTGVLQPPRKPQPRRWPVAEASRAASTSLADPASARRPCSTRGHNCTAVSSPGTAIRVQEEFHCLWFPCNLPVCLSGSTQV